MNYSFYKAPPSHTSTLRVSFQFQIQFQFQGLVSKIQLGILGKHKLWVCSILLLVLQIPVFLTCKIYPVHPNSTEVLTYSSMNSKV